MTIIKLLQKYHIIHTWTAWSDPKRELDCNSQYKHCTYCNKFILRIV